MSSRNISSMYISRRKPLAACVVAMFALSAPGLASAAVDWQVKSCGDTTATGTLRWAAANANGANGDTINLTTITDFSACDSGLNGANGTVAHTIQVGSTITLATGGVTINGPGATTLAVSAVLGNFRVLSSPGDLTVKNLTVKYASPSKASTSAYYGGCIYAHNNLTLSGVNLTHCYLSNTGSAKGGAVASFDNNVTMTNVLITNSTVTSTNTGNAFGGAVYAYLAADMTNSTIEASGSGDLAAYVTGGTGSALGGAIHAHSSTGSTGGVDLDGSKIYTAKAKVSSTTGGSANGGAIWSAAGVTLTASSVVRSSAASTASTAASKNSLGGGIYTGETAIVYQSVVESNSTTTSSSSGVSEGGGIFSKGITDAKYAYITSNSSGRGGGIYSTGGLISQYSYFWEDKASQYGGAVDVSAGNSTVRGTTVTYNTATVGWSGLDLHAGGASTVSVIQSTIAHNSGSFPLYSSAFGTTFDNNTVVYNANSGGAIAGAFVVGGNANSTLELSSNLLSSNTYGSSATKNDLSEVDVTISGSHNLIRNPGTGVPSDTITGKCPLLYPGKFTFIDKQYQFPIRHEVKSPATNAGSNPDSLTADQRGGSTTATSPPRVSGEPGTTAQADIGAYEINESDEVFDNRFETCT